jgi:hypothetical protein
MIEEQASYDARAFEREVLLKGVEIGAVVVGSPTARREVAKTLGIPTRITDEENAQISDAESKYYAFRDRSIVPTLDVTLDDHYIMYSVYGKFLKSNEGLDMAMAAGWPQTLVAIDGWQNKLRMAEQQDAQLRALEAQARSGISQAQQQLIAFEANTGEPYQNSLLPSSLTRRILYVWAKMGAQVQHPFTQFRAVVDAHRMLAEQKKQAAQVTPVMGAPGGMATTAGTEPVLGSMPAPGAGEEAAGISPGVSPQA